MIASPEQAKSKNLVLLKRAIDIPRRAALARFPGEARHFGGSKTLWGFGVLGFGVRGIGFWGVEVEGLGKDPEMELDRFQKVHFEG